MCIRDRFFHGGDGFFQVCDGHGRIIEANKAWCDLLGFTEEQILSVDAWELIHETDRIERPEIEHQLRLHGRAEPTFRVRSASGEYRSIRWTLLFDRTTRRCFSTGRDITDELQAQIDLTRRAYSDDLTGLANRTALLENLERWLGGPFHPAVLFCDLDRFKRVNDSLGHHAGDVLLQSLGARLSALLEGPDALLSRYGGDEFVILLGAATTNRAMETATRVLEALEHPFDVLGHEIYLAMSIGVAVATPELTVDDAASLIGKADAASYQAKRNGSNSTALAGSSEARSHVSRVEIEEALRAILTQKEIEVAYDPVLALPSRSVIGMEVHPVWPTTIGVEVDDNLYRKIAEESGFMPDIGLLVARKALADMATLTADGTRLILGLQSSSAELTFSGYAKRLASEIAAAGVDPELVAVNLDPEATITAAEIRPQVDVLRTYGIKVVLKQFGSRFSCLQRLPELEVDVITIDQELINDLGSYETSSNLVASLVQLFVDMGHDVVIEGVITSEQAVQAATLGARFGQPSKQDPMVSLEEIAAGVAQWAPRNLAA